MKESKQGEAREQRDQRTEKDRNERQASGYASLAAGPASVQGRGPSRELPLQW